MLQLLTKTQAIRRTIPGQLSASSRRTFADDKSDGNPADKAAAPKATADKPAAKESAGQSRLNELLASLSKDSNLDIVKTVVATKPKVLPTNRKPKAERLQSASETRTASNDDAQLVQAVKSVAAELGGDARRTESELLQKLLNRGAGADGGNINDLISGMQIDRLNGAGQSASPASNRSHFVRKSIEHAQDRRGQRFGGQQRFAGEQYAQQHQQQYRRKPPTPSDATKVEIVNLFGGKGLEIFGDGTALLESPDILQTWQRLQRRELSLAVTHPPSNHFQKMALWTEQGKLWRFPIDNEQGLDEEASVCFTEHIFLDRHLEGWCPPRGPIRHFMELVCVGLSKNPYYSVQQKIEHIAWFRDYFAEKKDILAKVIVEQSSTADAKQDSIAAQ